MWEYNFKETYQKLIIVFVFVSTLMHVFHHFEMYIYRNCVFPNVPPFPGIDAFQGRLLHSRDYRQAEEFKGQNVAVVGSSYSGKDVARQLSDFADKVKTLTNYLRAWMGFT